MSSGALERGVLLLEQRRLQEAMIFLRQAAGEAPDNPDVLGYLAHCEYATSGEEERALETIDRAISLDPNNAEHHALRALVLVSLRKPRRAILAADEARRLDPQLAMASAAAASAQLALENWREAEIEARRALKIDPENNPAANLLAEALRLQGRREETRENVAARLAQDPLDAQTHASAGWAALSAGDRDRAETHFVESLRLDPNMEWARAGLVEAFKARSAPYRLHLRYSFAMARISPGARWAVLIGLLLLVRVVRLVGPISMAVAAIYLLFVCWTVLSSGVGHFLVLLDPRARLSLNTAQRREGIAIGTSLFGGLLLLVTGWALHAVWLWGPGAGLLGASIPLTGTFTNDSEAGTIIFASIAAFCVLTGLLAALSEFALVPIATRTVGQMGEFACTAVAVSTWLLNIRHLRR